MQFDIEKFNKALEFLGGRFSFESDIKPFRTQMKEAETRLTSLL